ncbi:MAG: hypothetical protein ACI9KE_000110 [Polyangiales bacterium]|jgi:hypothetical protein
MIRWTSLLVFLCMACSPSSGQVRRDGGAGVTDTGPGFDGGAAFDSGPFDAGIRRDSGTNTCSSVSVQAESAIAPVDIVWVIDNSGSMSEEASLVQENINNFATAINSAGLDVHVIVITAAGFVEVPPPLGTDPERFLRVNQDVQSSNSFERLLGTLPMYQSFLRRNSALHFVVVSDDESDMGFNEFLGSMQSMIGRSFRFHAVVSEPGATHSFGGFNMSGCSGPNGDASDNGDEYWMLASRTGGRALSICTADWTALFSDLTTAISQPQALPCTYEIPPPPPGEEFDPNRVNVEYTPGGGAPQTIPNVGTLDRCTGEGWYYSGDPASPDGVELCPSTCARVEVDATGRVDVAFGCATLLI